MQKIFNLLLKYLIKKILTLLLIMYSPISFSDIFSFANELDKSVINKEDKDITVETKTNFKEKLKLVLVAIFLAFVLSLVLKNCGGGTPPPLVEKVLSKEQITEIINNSLKQQRLENVAELSSRISEILKKKS